jgi:Cu(I)/Ag(I) efflux system membrane fusion protein
MRHPLVALTAGLLLGALLLVLVPSDWLFRDVPTDTGQMASDGRKYACPMFCTMADAPGVCPVCGMDMEPIVDQGDKVPLGARERFMAGVRTEVVRLESGIHRLRALGHVRHDERRMGHITAWVSGRLDKLFVDFTGATVEAGDRVAEIYAPELVSAQEELLTASKAAAAAAGTSKELQQNARSLHAAARRRLLLLGLPETFVAAIEREGMARDRVEIQANVGGTVLAKRVNPGDYVKTGETLFTVVDLGVVWAMLEVFEEDAGSVFVGQTVEVEVPSLPGEMFTGRVSFVDPVLDTKRRVVRVRVDLANKEGRLKPGTFVDARILVELTSSGSVHDPAGATIRGDVLVIPRDAILDGGDRKLVYVMSQEPGPEKDGVERWPAIYEPREIRTGFRIGDGVVVLSGLEEGDEVVTRGQFLIDSQLQLTGKPSLMNPEAAAAPIDPHAGHRR